MLHDTLVLREFRSPVDYNLNHILQPAAALLGHSFHSMISLQTLTDCEVIQYLFRVFLTCSFDPRKNRRMFQKATSTIYEPSRSLCAAQQTVLSIGFFSRQIALRYLFNKFPLPDLTTIIKGGLLNLTHQIRQHTNEVIQSLNKPFQGLDWIGCSLVEEVIHSSVKQIITNGLQSLQKDEVMIWNLFDSGNSAHHYCDSYHEEGRAALFPAG